MDALVEELNDQISLFNYITKDAIKIIEEDDSMTPSNKEAMILFQKCICRKFNSAMSILSYGCKTKKSLEEDEETSNEIQYDIIILKLFDSEIYYIGLIEHDQFGIEIDRFKEKNGSFVGIIVINSYQDTSDLIKYLNDIHIDCENPSMKVVRKKKRGIFFELTGWLTIEEFVDVIWFVYPEHSGYAK